jgi:drug/metabolite transporter (DMT)-like permease
MLGQEKKRFPLILMSICFYIISIFLVVCIFLKPSNNELLPSPYYYVLFFLLGLIIGMYCMHYAYKYYDKKRTDHNLN